MKQGLRPLLLGTQLAAAFLFFQAEASAQCPAPNIGATVANPPVPQAGLTEVWVDPINGNDATGTVNNGTLPFFTATSALASVQAALGGGAGPGNRGLVHLGAGVYSVPTNGETFPLVMTDFVDLQGVGAKQTVLRGTMDPTINTFIPLTTANCDCGVRNPSIVLVDFSSATEPSYDEMIDSVTFQGADVQVYAEAGVHQIDGRVSNCIFDMLDDDTHPAVGYTGPSFGILMVHASQGPDLTGDPTDGEGKGKEPAVYNDVKLNIFNNTFVQSWEPDPVGGGMPTFSAQDFSVAICDVNDPDCFGPNRDIDTSLRGVGNPNIQNNLIRAFDATPPIALMGIDDGDVTCSVGTRLGATNAFDPAAVAGLSPFPVTPGMFFCSTIIGTAPTVVTDALGAPLIPNGLTAGGQDPAFVGEAISSQIPGLVPLTHARDWRLIASSRYVDQGTSPAGGVLQAGNGTVHSDIACMPQSSFDFDGEYWGNPRIEASALIATGSPAVIDIGYDEASILIDTGTANDSIVHAPFVVPQFGPVAGQGFRVFVYPLSNPTVPDLHSISAINTPLALLPAGFTAYSHFPGTLTLPVPVPLVLFSIPFNILWLDINNGGLGLFTYIPLDTNGMAGVSYTSPFGGGQQGFSLGFGPSALGQTGFPAYFAEQGFYLPAGGVNAGQVLLSNLQVVHD